jgi:hypothetical protein
MDTIDKVSEDSLRRIGWIATVAALTLANATAETAFLLANQTASKGITRIEDAFREAAEELVKKKEDPKLKDKPAELAKELAKTGLRYKNKIEHVMWREQEATKSAKKLDESPELNALINKLCEDIASQGQQKITRLKEMFDFVSKTSAIAIPTRLEETEAEVELRRCLPKRLFKGTLSFDELKKALGEREYEWYQEILERDHQFHARAEEFINFMDGKRSAYDIVKAVAAEYSETDPEPMLKFLRDLEKAKLITFE